MKEFHFLGHTRKITTSEIEGVSVPHGLLKDFIRKYLMLNVEANLFTCYGVGSNNNVVVSHLRFADDTLLMGVKSWANVRALQAVLLLFKAMSGLRVNFHKSMLIGVNIADSWLGEAAYIYS